MTKALVVGAGVMGLRTALELSRRNIAVTLRAAWHPLDARTCSQGAAGLWMPVHSPDPRTHEWALETLRELWPMAVDVHPHTCDGTQPPLVEKLMAVVLKRHHSGPTLQDYLHQEQRLQDTSRTQETPRTITTPATDKVPLWAQDPRLEFQHMTVEMLAWQNNTFRLLLPTEEELLQAGYLHAWLFRTVVVDAPRMLQHMLLDLRQQATVEIDERHSYETLEEMVQAAADIECDVLVNCTGLGAGALCPDEKQMVGGRGVLHLYDRSTAVRRPQVSSAAGEYPTTQPWRDAVVMTDEAPWATESMPAYLIPRGKALVVGGSMLKGDTEPRLRDHERVQLRENARRLGIDTEQCDPISEWTGYRPYRPTIRLEKDETFRSSGVTVVHNYGHGGSGWTISAGCARECADIISGRIS